MQSKFLQFAVLAAVCQAFVSSANAASIDINALEARAEGLNAKCKTSNTCGSKYYCNKGRCARKVKIGTTCRKAQQCRTGVCDAGTKKCVAKTSVTSSSASATATATASVSSSTSSSSTATASSTALPAYTPSFAPSGKTPLYTIQDGNFDKFDLQYWTVDNSNTDVGKNATFNGSPRIANSYPGNAILESSGSATGFEQALGSVAWTTGKNGAQAPSYTFAFRYLHYGSTDSNNDPTYDIADQCTLQPYIGNKVFDTIPLTPYKPSLYRRDSGNNYLFWASQAPFPITSDMISGTGKPVLGFNYLCTNSDSEAVLRIDDVRLYEATNQDTYRTVYSSNAGSFTVDQDISQWYSTGSTSLSTYGDHPQTYNQGAGNGNALFTWNSTAGLNGGTVFENLVPFTQYYNSYDDPSNTPPASAAGQTLTFNYDFLTSSPKAFPTTGDKCYLDITLGSNSLPQMTFTYSSMNQPTTPAGPKNFGSEWNNQVSSASTPNPAQPQSSQSASLAAGDANAASKQLKFHFYCDYDVTDATLRIDDVVFK
ncbi:hypothetical protein L7F22_068140 [Adiantum nelumboides]|nr:hypothetical protein [Adiantum nelumboides]